MPKTKLRVRKPKTVVGDVPEGFVRLPLTGAIVPAKKAPVRNLVRPLSWRELAARKRKSRKKAGGAQGTFIPSGSTKQIFSSPEEARRWLRKFHQATSHLQHVKSLKKKRKFKGPRPVFYQGGAPGLVQQR
jgi:hypothetical protein